MKDNTDPKKHYLWGTLLIWFGVLVWIPFIFMKMTGANPSFLLYLPFHLIGVVGGAGCSRGYPNI